MPIDRKLVQQVRAAAKKPRNFIFAPGKDNGVLSMSTKKFSPAQISDAKSEAGATKIVKGLVKVVNGELVFENLTIDDKQTETKLRKTLKLNTGLTQKIQLVKVATVQELDEEDVDVAAESDKLSDDEKEKMRKAEYKQRRTEVARQVDRLRELMPQAADQLAQVMQQIAALEIEEDYRKGFEKLEKLEGMVHKLMPGAEADSLKTRMTAMVSQIKQLAPLDKAKSTQFQTELKDLASQVPKIGPHDALPLVAALEPRVRSALIRAQGGDDGVGAAQDENAELPASDQFRLKDKAVKAGIERICKWAGVDINAPQMHAWNSAYQDALEKAKVFQHGAAVTRLSGIEKQIAAAEQTRTELNAALPRLWAVITAAEQAGEISTDAFKALDAKLTGADLALRRLQFDEARQRAHALQDEALALKGTSRLYSDAAAAVKGLLDGIEKGINDDRQLQSSGPVAGRGQLRLQTRDSELMQLRNQYENTEHLAETSGHPAAYKQMTRLEAIIRAKLRAWNDAAEQSESVSFDADDTPRGAQMVAGKSTDAITLKVKLELENMRRALPMVATFDPQSAAQLEHSVEGVEEALQIGARTAQTVLPAVLAQFKEVVSRMQASRPKAPTRQTAPGRPGSAPPLAAETTDRWASRVGNINRYKLGAVLGAGARGEARLMTDPNDPNAPPLVAKQSGSRVSAEQIYQEAENYKKLGDHPNIAKCLGVREIEGQKSIVMEAVQGKSAANLADNLRARLAKGEINSQEYWSTVQYTLAKMLEGLAHMHRAGFTHNDIKPDNVMVDKNTGEVKLIDMGGVEAVGQDYDDRRSEFTGGYAAPERFGKTTGQTDAFAAGASAYEMAESKKFDYKDKAKASAAASNFEFEDLAKLFVAPQEALTQADDKTPLTRKVDEGGRDVDLDQADAGSKTVKQAGRYAAKTAYVDFLNALMNPDPNKRLSPEEALQHPFLRDRLLDEDKVREVMKKALLPSDVPTQGKEPERERFDMLFTNTGNLVSVSNLSNKIVDGVSYRDEARDLDVAGIAAAGLVKERQRLMARLNDCRERVRETREPTQLLQRIADSAVVTDNDFHVEDLKLLDLLRKASQTYTHAASEVQARIDEIDARVAGGGVLQFSSADLDGRVNAFAEQRVSLTRRMADIVDSPSPELGQLLDNLEHFHRQVLAMKQAAAAEKALMQTMHQAMSAASGMSAARVHAQLPNAAKLLTEIDKYDIEIDKVKAEVEKKQAEVKASVSKIAADLKGLQRAIGGQVIKITAQFQKEGTTAAAYDQAAKKPRNTAVQMDAFEQARKQFEEASQGHKTERQAIRGVTEKAISQLSAYKVKLGPRPLADFPTLMHDIDVEIGRLKFEPRLFSDQ